MTRRALCLLFLTGLTGCGHSNQRRKEQSKVHLAWLITAILEFHRRENQYPDSLQELAPLFDDDTIPDTLRDVRDRLAAYDINRFEQILTNPRTGSNPGYEYVLPASDVSADPVIYQLDGSARLEDKDAAYLDGNVR